MLLRIDSGDDVGSCGNNVGHDTACKDFFLQIIPSNELLKTEHESISTELRCAIGERVGIRINSLEGCNSCNVTGSSFDHIFEETFCHLMDWVLMTST